MSNPYKKLFEDILADIESDESLVDYIQPDIDSNKNLIQRVPLPMNVAAISNGFISSSDLGPCIVFLFQFTSQAKANGVVNGRKRL